MTGLRAAELAGTGSAHPRVSVVIPAFNAGAYLDECLASATAQHGDFLAEVIVVDDGSTDDTPGIARRHAQVRLLQQGHRGASAARNAGIAASTCDYIAFLDADDLWPPASLAARLKVLLGRPDAALVFGDCRQFDEGGPWPRSEFASNRLGAAAWGAGDTVPDAYLRLLQDNFITTGSVLARKAVLTETGGFDESLRLVEDLDLWLRIARHHPVAWCAETCLLRRRHANNLSRDAEAMGLAYLEMLLRQRGADGAPVELADRISRLAASEYLHLAEIARTRGQARTAVARAWRSLLMRPHPRALWHLGRAAASLVAPARGTP